MCLLLDKKIRQKNRLRRQVKYFLWPPAHEPDGPYGSLKNHLFFIPDMTFDDFWLLENDF